MDKETPFDYKTIKTGSIAEFKDRGSKFIGYTYHVTQEEEVQEVMDKLKKEHLKARHHCYAYILDKEGQQFRANDDGEPSGTAGKPIYGQLLKYDLKKVLIVVVRYFGGTKLGTSGLINAYRTVAEAAILDSEVIAVRLKEHFRLDIDYGKMGHVMNCVKSLGIDITDKTFTNTASIDISINADESDAIIQHLKAVILQVSEEQVDEETTIDYCEIIKLGTYA